MDKLNKIDLNEEFERVWQKCCNLSDSYEIAEIFFNQGYENGYLDGLKDGRAL